jgi:hypothetical protein
MATPRGSILNRKVHVGPYTQRTNAESSEADYAREMARIDMKRRSLAQYEEHRSKAFFGDRNEKHDLQLTVRQEMDRQRELKSLHEQKEKEELDRLVENAQRVQMRQRQIEIQRMEARRDYLTHLKEDNMKAAEEKRMQKVVSKQMEHEVARNQPNYFEKWGKNAL